MFFKYAITFSIGLCINVLLTMLKVSIVKVTSVLAICFFVLDHLLRCSTGKTVIHVNQQIVIRTPLAKIFTFNPF